MPKAWELVKTDRLSPHLWAATNVYITADVTEGSTTLLGEKVIYNYELFYCNFSLYELNDDIAIFL